MCNLYQFFGHVACVCGLVLLRHVDDMPHRLSAGRQWRSYGSAQCRRSSLLSHLWYLYSVLCSLCTGSQPQITVIVMSFFYNMTNFKTFVVILGKSHYMIYSLVTAMKPRMLVTFDKDFNPLPVSVRVGQVCAACNLMSNMRTAVRVIFGGSCFYLSVW